MVLTLSEMMVKSIYEAQGWKVLRHGAPDFVFYKEKKNGEIGDVVFVEVKGFKRKSPVGVLDASKYQKLEPHQELYRRILLKLGAKYVIEPFNLQNLKKEGEARVYETRYLRNLKSLDNFILREEMKSTRIIYRIWDMKDNAFTTMGFAYDDNSVV